MRQVRTSIAHKVAMGMGVIVLAATVAMFVTHHVSTSTLQSIQESQEQSRSILTAAANLEFDTTASGLRVYQYLEAGDVFFRDAHARHSLRARQSLNRLLVHDQRGDWQHAGRLLEDLLHKLDHSSQNVFQLESRPDARVSSAQGINGGRPDSRAAELLRMSDLHQQFTATLNTELKPVLLQYTDAAADKAGNRMLQALLLAGGTSFLLSLLALFAYLYIRSVIVDPIRRLSRGTDAITAGDLNHRVVIDSRDEFADLAANFNRMVGELQDTTVSKALHEQQEMELRTLFDSVRDYAIFSVDANGFVTHWNQTSSRILGYDAKDMQGVSFIHVLKNRQDADVVRDELPAAIAASGRFEIDTTLVRKNGDAFEANVVVTPLRTGNAGSTGYTVVVRDVTERMKTERHIEKLATRDALTGLFNRSMLMEQMHTAIARAARTQSKLAVMFIDLDHFKIVNDTLGHSAGDELLRESARRLTDCVRENDIVARLGGDEFVVLLSDIADTALLTHVANRMLQLLTTPFQIQGHEARVSASIGICCYPSDGADVTTLMKNADIAMYHAKDLNRNNYQFYAEEMNLRMLRRLQLERELRTAVENNEFVLYFQPQINVSTGEIQGAESLVRWQHPTEGLLLPSGFIPVAEETGLILPLGRWILDEACRNIKQWRTKGIGVPYVVVNVSAVQLSDDLVTSVRDALVTHDIEPGWLMLEITETMLMERVEEGIAILRRIRELGIRIAMDDFGTGYSSLSILQRLPLDTLKIDRSFVVAIDDEANSGQAVAIIGAIIAIAKELNLSVVAEGVESTTQLAFLRTLACDTYQGFLYSRPIDAASMERRFAAPIKSVLEDENGRAVTMALKVNLELPEAGP